ncbi:MAG: hypothetical protein R2708_27300 [Vicinamibacterales bacterium]
MRVDNAVFLGKTTGLSMINASASPMLSAAEAPWIASEMRRALRQDGALTAPSRSGRMQDMRRMMVLAATIALLTAARGGEACRWNGHARRRGDPGQERPRGGQRR